MSPLTLCFDHRDFAVVAKPAGMSFHSETGAGFVVRAAELTGCPLYPVHRLDKMTSGLVILAKSSEAAAAFTALFEKREIEKYYLALSLRKPKKKQGWIKGDMAKARRGDWKLLKTTENPAVTRFISATLREGERAFLVKPYTGKTHQIRVALKSLGSPIAGDVRYADKAEAEKEERGYLHAYALRFTYNDEPYRFTFPPDEGERFLSPLFSDLLQEWQAPWEHFPEKK
ncbi:TIGR01621 family pseudouridine synthase [Sulfurimonas sp. HSL-3221]|uniref:TIGR01621 family pseudouridine synthase n=1 Tax=Sulfurimonadaceae TaxID=2771471 RepID=UPI001E599515|nr:TIGR01621 family pseudouridine synthase [Sulfurimonas sp. HSL-3221]UFS61682.1 TIGR01621 family pseudouridine synthase [Sulfurimonas sp. HSL-3221]